MTDPAPSSDEQALQKQAAEAGVKALSEIDKTRRCLGLTSFWVGLLLGLGTLAYLIWTMPQITPQLVNAQLSSAATAVIIARGVFAVAALGLAGFMIRLAERWLKPPGAGPDAIEADPINLGAVAKVLDTLGALQKK